MKKTIISVLTISLLVISPLNNNNHAYAHGGEDHGDSKQKSAGSLTDEFEVPKETQFLFDIGTANSHFSDYNNILTLFGKVMPATNGSAQIIAPQNGSIVSLNVGIGQKVAKGEVLALVEQLLNAPEQVQAATGKSNAEAEYEAAKKEYDRLKSIQDVVAKKDFLQAEIRLKTAEANKKIYDNLSGNNSKVFAIKSPIDGMVDNFNLSIGQQVEQGEQMFNVYDTRKVKVEAQLYGKDLDKITKETQFLVEYASEGNKTVSAKLVAISNLINSTNQASKIILEIENENGILKPGQFVNVDVLGKSEKKQLIVPTSAISDINGKPVVFIHHEPEIFKVVFVQLGQSNIENTVVLKGLEENERVVTGGTYQMKSIYLNQ